MLALGSPTAVRTATFRRIVELEFHFFCTGFQQFSTCIDKRIRLYKTMLASGHAMADVSKIIVTFNSKTNNKLVLNYINFDHSTQ